MIYQPVDLVYFRSEAPNQWKGPGTVLGNENKQILVKYGGSHIRVYACQLTFETEKPSNEIQVPEANNVISSSRNSYILEQPENNGIVENY